MSEAKRIAEKIRKNIQDNAYVSHDETIVLTISLGVSQAEENDQDVSIILSRADIALYQAKDSGRNKVVNT